MRWAYSRWDKNWTALPEGRNKFASMSSADDLPHSRILEEDNGLTLVTWTYVSVVSSGR